ncbi:hypothetical protein [Sphaerisporangium aureirubrum]|uniref:Uncharacterized protein n=1 Tax=Sphaerisporangium aureirubrum TaxID=1544736 RepID=A0ABW1NKU1_9ACTN
MRLAGGSADRPARSLKRPAALETLRRLSRDTEDVLLAYFAGHGTIVRRGQLCLVLTDTDTDADDPDITGLEFERVREAQLTPTRRSPGNYWTWSGPAYPVARSNCP